MRFGDANVSQGRDESHGSASYAEGVPYIRADLKSSIGMTPFFSPSMGSANRLKASLISPSSCAEMLCSLASFDRGGALGAPAAAPVLRFGGC